MVGDRQLDSTKLKVLPPSTTHGMNLGSLGPRMQRKLIGSDDRRAVSFGDRDRIPIMICMGMADQDVITSDIIRLGRRLRIPGQEWIDEYPCLGRGNQKTGMSQILDRDARTHEFTSFLSDPSGRFET